jgi:ATP-dependent RNA helicase MSS116, mitochondrial
MAAPRCAVLFAAYLSFGSCLCSFHVPQNRITGNPLFLSSYNEEDSSRPSKRIRPLRFSSMEDKVANRRIEAQERREQALLDPSLLTCVKFVDREDMHPATKRAVLEVLQLQEMTQIQAETYSIALQGSNIIGRARTGTGKTLAYLLPSLERLLQGDRDVYIPGRTIGVLIVAPTRELAQQIADQACSLLTYHSSEMTVACLYGGTKMRRDINLLSNPSRLPTILVATPGRLLEHLLQTKIQGRKFSDILDATKIVVLDEMDCLLGIGFQKDVSKVLSYLSRRRQTLLFSATFPSSMRKLIDDVLGKDFKEINCVDERDATSLTNTRVDQSFVFLESMEDYVWSMVEIIEQEAKCIKNFKIVIFLPTTKLVDFFFELLDSGLGLLGVSRLHSRMSQSARQRTSQNFRSTLQPSILVTTDVSSRGVDYPDVTLVVQYGSPSSEDTYIHRLGRTGRAGRQGRGVQVVLPFERRVVSKLKGRGVVERPEMHQSTQGRTSLEKVFRIIRSGDVSLTPAAQAAYRSFLAFYLERAIDLGLVPSDIVDSANTFSRAVGLRQPPGLAKKTAVRLGIENLVEVHMEE